MTPKRSLFNYYLKHFRWMGLMSCIVFLFLYPVYTALSLQNIELSAYNMTQEHLLEEWVRSVTSQMGTVQIVAFLVATIAGIAAFSYLHDRTKIDFYHAQPVPRGKLFLCRAFAAAIWVLVPLVLFGLSSIVILVIRTGNQIAAWQYVRLVCAPLLNAVVAMGFASLAGMLAGTLFAHVAGTAFLIAFIPLTLLLARKLLALLLPSFPEAYWRVVGEAFTPVLFAGKAFGETFAVWWLIDALVFAGVLFAAAFFLYRKRKSEMAQRTLTFAFSRPIIETILMTWSALGFGLILQSMGGFGFLLFGFFAGVLLAYILCEAVFSKTLKGMFKHWRLLVAYTLCFCVIISLLLFDVTGYETRTPKMQSVREVSIAEGNEAYEYNGGIFFSNNCFVAQHVFRDQQNIDDGSALWSSAAVNARDYGRKKLFGEKAGSANRETTLNVYAVRSNGTKFVRSYLIASDKEFYEAIKALKATEEYQAGLGVRGGGRPVESLSLWDYVGGAADQIKDPVAIELLLSAYEADAHTGEPVAGFSVDYRSQGAVYFKQNTGFYITKSDTRTLALIERYTKLSTITPQEWIAASLKDYPAIVIIDQKNNSLLGKVTQEADIQEVLEKGVYERLLDEKNENQVSTRYCVVFATNEEILNYYNKYEWEDSPKQEENTETEILTAAEEYRQYSFYFRKGDLPACVEEAVRENA